MFEEQSGLELDSLSYSQSLHNTMKVINFAKCVNPYGIRLLPYRKKAFVESKFCYRQTKKSLDKLKYQIILFITRNARIN